MVIDHIKQHITKLFGITEPFHVMLNDTEYLPPMEDVRILKENETILVAPGSGLQAELEPSPNITVLENERGNFPQYGKSSNSTRHKETKIFGVPQAKAAAALDGSEFRNNGLSEMQADISSIETTFHSVIEDNELESATESKATDSNITDDSATISGAVNWPNKKKRTRHRKSKKQANIFALTAETWRRQLEHSMQRVKEEVKVENVSDEETRTIAGAEMKLEGRTGESLGKETFKAEINGDAWQKGHISIKNVATCPRMTERPQIGDMIAFKIWRITQNYSPYMSEYIIAKVMSYCPKKEEYTFDILEGKEQFPVSGWDFGLGENEIEILNDNIATLNYSQIKDVLLVSKSHSDNAVVPTCCDA
ncbi:hypothetical protein KM043_004741 [Ampulex compressa]|nr:hypothetical protein KM043_004741 [Ampulex compressa]